MPGLWDSFEQNVFTEALQEHEISKSGYVTSILLFFVNSVLKTLLSAFNHTQKSSFGLWRIYKTNFMALTWTFLSTSFLAIGVIAREQAHKVQEKFWRSSCQRAMNSDFSSRDKGSASEIFLNLAQVNLLAGYPRKGVLTLEFVTCWLLPKVTLNLWADRLLYKGVC